MGLALEGLSEFGGDLELAGLGVVCVGSDF